MPPPNFARGISFELREDDDPDQGHLTVAEMEAMDGRIKMGGQVWLRGLRGGQAYTQATLTGLDKSGDAVVRLADGETARVRPDTCYAANSADQTPGDLAALIHLNEPCVLECTRLRYANDDIYTYTGRILIALNPFKPLALYGLSLIHI